MLGPGCEHGYGGAMTTTRMQVTLDREDHRRAAEKASQLGVSLAEYIRGLVAADLDPDAAAAGDISEIFGVGDSRGSDVAANEDHYLAEAILTDARPRRQAD